MGHELSHSHEGDCENVIEVSTEETTVEAKGMGHKRSHIKGHTGDNDRVDLRGGH